MYDDNDNESCVELMANLLLLCVSVSVNRQSSRPDLRRARDPDLIPQRLI